jgi:hypothetical protein
VLVIGLQPALRAGPVDQLLAGQVQRRDCSAATGATAAGLRRKAQALLVQVAQNTASSGSPPSRRCAAATEPSPPSRRRYRRCPSWQAALIGSGCWPHSASLAALGQSISRRMLRH